MSKKLLLVFLFVFFFNSQSGEAAVVVNEIMYDLDGADIDWVEVMNNGNEDIDLSTLKLLISNSTSNHGINNSSGSSILHGGEFGVIVNNSVISNYTEKWGSNGNIFTASFSLPNESGKIEINDGGKDSPIFFVSFYFSL